VLVDARGQSKFDTALGCEQILSDAIDAGASQSGGWSADASSVDAASSELAYLQYTSGSTGNPKGVCITHANVLANLEQITRRLRLPNGVTIVSWLPHHHDQGLVGGLLLAVYLGGTCYAMTPASFVVRPLRWLEAISRYRAHLSGGPNFAFDSCTRAAKHSRLPLSLDLSTWRVAFNGAERVASSTLHEFSHCFAPYGFHHSAWSPCYGLAEATLAVSMVSPAADRSADPPLAFERDGALHVACGSPMEGTEVAIVDAETGERRAAGELGEIWLRGPSIAARYWRQDASTGALPSAVGSGHSDAHIRASGDQTGNYLRTGDFGFLQAGQLVIIGRREDRCKIHGRNVFAADLERACRLASADIADCAAFMSQLAPLPHLAVELRRAAADKLLLPALGESIMQAVHRECDVSVAAIHFVRQGSLPRTTSGKVRRAECARLLLSSRIEILGTSSSGHDASGADTTASDPLLQNLRAVLRSLELTHLCDLDAHAVIRLDSLDQLRVQHAMETMFGVRTSIWSSTTTLQDVCSAIRAADSSESQAAAPQPSGGVLTDLQQDILIADRLCDSELFTIGCVVHVGTDVSLASLVIAFDKLLERHPILANSGIEHADDALVRSKPNDAPLVEDLSFRPGSEREVVEAWFSKPLTLGPHALIRAAVYRGVQESAILIAAHHLVADHASMAQIAMELEALCRAPLMPLPPPVPYSAYAAKHAEIVRTQGESLRAFWKEQLRELVDPPLLNRAARQPIQDWSVRHVTRELPSKALASIRRCADRAEATMSSVVLAAFGLLIMRYTATSRTTVSCAVSLRDTPELLRTIGYLINSVPIRIGLDVSKRFTDLCRAVRAELDMAKSAAAYAQHLIGRELTVHADGDPVSLLSRYVLNFLDERYAPELHIEPRPSHPLAELQLTVRLSSQRLRLEVSALASRYPQEVLNECVEGLAHLLTHASVIADEALPDISVLSATQLQRLSSFESPALALRSNRLEEFIDARTSECPDRVALMAPGEEGAWEQLTYSELRERSNALAGTLLGARGKPIAVVMERSIDQIIAILGILRAGAIYLPIDPQLPTARIQLMFDDSRCPCALVDADQAERLRGCGVPLLQVRHMKFKAPVALRGASDQEPATLIYTSGSTGRPKGVLLPHAAHAARLQAMQMELRVHPDDVFIQKTSISFDVSIWEIFLPLICGARLVLAPRAASFDPQVLTQILEEACVSIVHFVPTMLREWLASGEAPRVARYLKRCLCSGESLRAEHRDLFARLLPDTSLINLYGPTECGIDVSWSTDLGATGDPPIGRPTANSRISILSNQQAMPPNVRGQLIIAGPQLAFGYWGRPDLTAERFVPALDGASGERAYLTGDHGLWRNDGQLTYLGRMDRQVKVRGVRIELDDVRHALLIHPDVEQAEVFVVHAAGDASLAAAVLSRMALTSAEVQEHVFALLPASAVPTSICVLASFPTLSNGKCDLGQLKALLEASTAELTTHQGVVSEAVAQAWRAVLSVTLGAGARFFAAGGDSIKAIRLVNELAQRGISASVADIYRFQSIDEQSRRFTVANSQSLNTREYQPFQLLNEAARRSIEHEALEDAYPLSMLQRTVVMQSFGGPQYETYVSGVRLRARFVHTAFEAAVTRLMQAHPFLRSSFDLTRASEALQLVHAHAMPPIVVRDLMAWDADAASREIQRWTRTELANPFAWHEAPLLRFTVHLLRNDEFVVSMTDAALDGWCVALTLVDLIAGYDAFVAAQTPKHLPQLPSYGAFLQLEREAVASIETRQFWREKLLAVKPQQIPRWRAPSRSTRSHRRVEVPVPAEILSALQSHASARGLSIKHVFLALYCVMLAVLRERDTVVAMIECNGRPECDGGDRMIGVFNNIVPFEVGVSGRTWAQLAAELFKLETEWQPHRRLPIAEILREQSSRSLSDSLFVFTHFHVLDSLRDLAHVRVLDMWASDETYLSLTFHVNTSAWHGTRILLDYDEAELHDGHMEWLAEWLTETLQSLPQGMDSLCAPKAQDLECAVRRYWSAHGGSVIERVFEQSRQHPLTIAIVEGQHSVTYETLRRRAIGYAEVLRESGVGCGEPVGLVAHAGIDAVCAMLGAWLVGACCVLIDPEQPRRRIDSMLVNVGARVAWFDEPNREPLEHGPAVQTLSFNLPAAASTAVGAQLLTTQHPTQAAYILHTSGSTGQPKPVAISHAALTNYIDNAQQLYGLVYGDRVWNHSSLGFDFTLTTLIAPLCAGANVICVGRHDLATILHDALSTDVIKLTPTHLQILRRHPDLDPTRLPTRIIVGGELLYTHDVQALQRIQPSIRIFNEYGPTEACVGCSVQENQGEGQHAIEAIGAPIEGMQVHLLDGNLTPILSDGVTGELYLSGLGLALGYPGHAEVTAEKFVPCPFGPPGSRMYRTGDVAQLVAGRIVCIGRVDRQIKVRGHRVELGEIESCLASCAEVARAVAAVREGRVVAWILLHRRLDTLRAHLIRLHIEMHLPEYMRPERIYELTFVPLTAHGKINGDALREEGEPVVPAAMNLMEWISSLSDEDASHALQQVQLRQVS
jgi:nonribosomal peptide synthetase protein BlmVI